MKPMKPMKPIKETSGVFGVCEPTPQDVSNFLFDACKYIKDRRPFEMATIAILQEKSYDVMDAEVGRLRALEVN